MDKLWHAAILDTQFYKNLQVALDFNLRHRPAGASEKESEQRKKRLETMNGLYRAFFATEPTVLSVHKPVTPAAGRLRLINLAVAKPQSSPFHIFITKDRGPRIMEMTVCEETTGEEVLAALDREGWSQKKYRLFLSAERFEDLQL